MTAAEIKSYIDRILGNSIRCLLPAYWWKKAFGAVVDKVAEVEMAIPTDAITRAEYDDANLVFFVGNITDEDMAANGKARDCLLSAKFSAKDKVAVLARENGELQPLALIDIKVDRQLMLLVLVTNTIKAAKDSHDVDYFNYWEHHLYYSSGFVSSVVVAAPFATKADITTTLNTAL